jgi:hypothetical protein
LRASVVKFPLFLPLSMMIIPSQAFIETWQQKTVLCPDLRGRIARRNAATDVPSLLANMPPE